MNIQKCKENHRICVVCKEEKPATSDFFYKDKNRLLGLMYRCKTCDKLRKDNRTWEDRKLKRTPEQYTRSKKQQSIYNKSEKGKSISLFTQYRKFDTERGYKTTVTKEDVRVARLQPCTYCGFPSTGFDRVDNKIGHTKENCIPACKECNIARMDNFSHEEMKILGEAIRQVKNNRISNN